jgi:hypothetical protein
VNKRIAESTTADKNNKVGPNIVYYIFFGYTFGTKENRNTKMKRARKRKRSRVLNSGQFGAILLANATFQGI